MAFFVSLVAVAWRGGNYSVASQTTGEVNIKLLTERHLLNDVSSSPAYLDKMAVVSKRQFEEYLPPATDLGASATHAWYRGLPDEAEFILIHNGEWSSGL